MPHFVCIYVSLETICLGIVDASGCVVRELIADSEPEVLATALHNSKLDFSNVGLEPD